MRIIEIIKRFFGIKTNEPTFINYKKCDGAGINESHMTLTTEFDRMRASKDGLQNNCRECKKEARKYKKNQRKLGGTSEHSKDEIIVDETLIDLATPAIEPTFERSNAEVQRLFKTPKKFHEYKSMTQTELFKAYSKERREGDEHGKARRMLRAQDPFALLIYDLTWRRESGQIRVARVLDTVNAVIDGELEAKELPFSKRFNLENANRIKIGDALLILKNVQFQHDLYNE